MVVRQGVDYTRAGSGWRCSVRTLTKVLALVPSLGYEDMAITDGQVAAALYQRALANDNLAERQRTLAALRAYCRRDTLATLELRRALAELARTA